MSRATYSLMGWAVLLVAASAGCGHQRQGAQGKAPGESANAVKEAYDTNGVYTQGSEQPVATDEPKAAEAAPATAVPQMIAAGELTGTLQIDVEVPMDQGVLIGDKGWWPPLEGWFFIGEGQLVGRLPLHKAMQLIPGDYPVKLVAVLTDREQGTCFYVLSGRVTVERGRTAPCRLQSLREPPAGFTAVHSALGTNARPLREMGPRDGWEARSAKNAESAERGWEIFIASAEWKAVAAAADRLRLAPPSRPRVWIDLPNELGGPRELDVDQLKRLHRWLIGRLLEEMDVYVGFYNDTSDASSAARSQNLARYERVEKYRSERSTFVHKTVWNMIDTLRKAPAEAP